MTFGSQISATLFSLLWYALWQSISLGDAERSWHWWIIDSFVFALQIEKLRKQAEDQEATLLAQEEEVHGKQRELDALKEEEKKLLEDIKNSEKEIQKLSHDLEVATEINSEVNNSRLRILQ